MRKMRGAMSFYVLLLFVIPLEAFLVESPVSLDHRPLLMTIDGNIESCDVISVKNLRPVVPGSTVYRSATLDNLTEEDAERLLNGSAFDVNRNGAETIKPLSSVIDLRNADEIDKGEKVRTKGSEVFYNSPNVDFISIPILGNVDSFWEEAIATMDPMERIMATLQTVVVGGALDRAAARHLEQGGLPLLYAIMMKTGGRKLAMALEEILRVSASTNGAPVIFHCQKGKDRTGVLAMLLQTCLRNNIIDSSDADVVDAYALSGELLGELPGQSKGDDDSSSSTSTIDWSYFRGSPREAMIDTLAWVRGQYGSVEQYLDSISFGEAKRAELRKHCQK